MNSLIIKDVVLAKPTGNRLSVTNSEFGIEKENWKIEFEVLKMVTCVIDIESNKAIDIETNECFDIVKRDNFGKIMKSHLPQIINGETMALQLREKDWKNMSVLYQLELKSRAQRVWNRYFTNLNKKTQENSIQKTKRKDKN